ncbi:MAG: DUF262 domain-containing protein [Nitrososphaerales archaeon]
MANFEPIVLTVREFKDLYDRGLLELTPKFQRRSVWTPNIKSYFLDTLFQDLPSPKIYLRERLSPKRRLVKEVVDGQQRLRTIIDFIQNEFVVKPKYNAEIGDMRFAALPRTLRDEFLDYKLSVDVMKNATDQEVLDMFARLNTFTVTLNDQELRNAKFHGEFKTAMYNLASKNLAFLLENRILSQRAIVRMADAELASELVIAMLWGLQDKKKSISRYYKEYDTQFPQEEIVVPRFAEILHHIGQIFGGVLSMSSFHKRALFYSLFCCMYDLEYGLPGENGPYGRIEVASSHSARQVLSHLTNQIESVRPRPEFAEFVRACQRQTDNIIPRKVRHQVILTRLRPLAQSVR